MPKVSIIVPVYNTQEYLSDCLDSLINQTLHDIEIILVDDGSTDESGYICDRYCRNDSRIKVIHKKNGGQSCARNNGLKAAQGEYILFVDSDDWIIPETCEKLLLAAENGYPDIVHGDMFAEKKRIEQDSQFRWLPCEGEVVFCSDYLKDVIKYKSYDVVPVLNFIRKDYLLKNNLYFHEGCFYEDQEYALKLFTANGGNGTIKKIRLPYYFYRFNPCSTTNNTTLKKVSDILVVFVTMTEYIENYNSSDEEIIESMKSITNLCLYHLSSFFSRLSKQDRKIMCLKLRNYRTLLKNVASWKCLSTRIAVQTRLFASNPWIFSHFLVFGRNFLSLAKNIKSI